MGYPCWRYHATEEPRRVVDEAGEAALGPGWYDSPAKAAASLVPPDGDIYETPAAATVRRSGRKAHAPR